MVTIWLRLEPYRTAGSKVVLRVEDNGPGVPESIRDHLFEPFVSQSPGRERLGPGAVPGRQPAGHLRRQPAV